ncbi:hypothetical protein P2318_11930 [Myxococcaceae bacterium GXIMD 01537]
MLRRLAVASALVTAACAGTQKQETAKPEPKMVQERQKIVNQPAFDVAACQPRQLALPQPLNTVGLIGGITAVRPEVMECLVDPKNRGAAEETRVTVNAKDGKYVVEGTNTTPTGIACVQGVLDKLVPLTTLPANTPPMEKPYEFVHELGKSASVVFGINEGSDFSGAVRLAQPAWCDCYAGFAATLPPVVKIHVKLKKGMPTPAEVTTNSTGSTEGDALAACLKPKLAAVPAKLSVDELGFDYNFVHLNSLAPATAGLSPNLAFYQLEAVRTQRSADVALGLGQRANAAAVYDAAVQQYKKAPSWKLVDELKTKCATLVKASDASVATIEALRQTEQTTLETAQALKVQDAEWGKVETAVQESLNQTNVQLKTAQATREADMNACPKEKKK